MYFCIDLKIICLSSAYYSFNKTYHSHLIPILKRNKINKDFLLGFLSAVKIVDGFVSHFVQMKIMGS